MTRQELEAVTKIMIVFLGSLLFFSMLNGAVTLFMVIGALSVTYLFVHYWEKWHYRQQRAEKVK